MVVPRRSLTAIGLALLTAVATFSYLGQLDDTVAVVVAARDLQASQAVSPADVRLREIPFQAVHPAAFSDPAAVIGRYLLVPVVQDQVLLDPHLSPQGVSGPLTARLSPGHVAFFVPLSLGQGLGGALRPGDRIDLMMVSDRSEALGALAHVVASGVPVIEVRDEYGRPRDAQAEDRTLPAGVLVEVTPLDAARLAHALEHGVVYAALHPAGGGQSLAPDSWSDPRPAVPVSPTDDASSTVEREAQ